MRQQSAVRRAVLVYQAGIANVFAVESFNMADSGRDAKRLLQSDFRSCEMFARGLEAAGVLVASAHCNQAGDIAHSAWTLTLDDAPFSDSFRPVYSKNAGSELPENYGLLH
jgi:hypothetical protein